MTPAARMVPLPPLLDLRPVLVVTLHEGASPRSLLNVRATTLRIVAPATTRDRYVLDEIPGDPTTLADELAGEPWCAEARPFTAFVAYPDEPPPPRRAFAVPFCVADPALGPLRYHPKR